LNRQVFSFGGFVFSLGYLKSHPGDSPTIRQKPHIKKGGKLWEFALDALTIGIIATLGAPRLRGAGLPVPLMKKTLQK